jgi:sarcosine oxidase subunit alpha
MRLAAPFGSLIDRKAPVSFTFEGRPYAGFVGDTLASALAANNTWLISRSFKYHRPRGVLTMSGDDGNTMVQVGQEPNVLADTLPIRDGLTVMGQHYTGSLVVDYDRWVEIFSRFLPVGFYYRAFFKPKGVWNLWEKFVRAKAGLGRVDTSTHHGYYDKAYAFADVAVIGGGVTGMAAALEAAKADVEVVLVERQPILGGSLNYTRVDVEGTRGTALVQALTSQLQAAKNVTIMTEATCTGWFTDNFLPIIIGNRMVKLRAGEVIVATGAIEQPAVFRNNDLPGIMLGSAAQRLIRLYGVRPGQRAVVACYGGTGYGVALDLLDAGVDVAAIVDLSKTPTNNSRRQALKDTGVEILQGYGLREAIARKDGAHVSSIVAAPITSDGQLADTRQTIECDLLCMSTGWLPAASLVAHAAGEVSYAERSGTFVVRSVVENMQVAGAVNGEWVVDAAIEEGRQAGAAASGKATNRVAVPRRPDDRPAQPWTIFSHEKGKEFVDFDEDLTVADLQNSVAEGFDDIELVKRFSTVVMGPSQGRVSALNALRLVQRHAGKTLEGARGSTNRPPVTPEKFGHLCGRGFEPIRLTAMHYRHVEAGAEMMLAGAWLRPGHYGTDGDHAIHDEVKNVRDNVGLIDVSTLGGLDIRGPDAAEFLDRVYTLSYARQPVGRARYVLMCDQSGAIADDGVACRFSDEHFYVTATTGGSDAVYRTMLFWNAQWRLNVDITNVTGGLAAVNIAGPRSRDVLEKFCSDVDLSAAAFPYMGVRMARVADIPARLLRVGFVGELGYEIHAPSSMGEALWDALMEAGFDFGIKPFGVEAQRILRLEKGHIIITQDTDGLTHPHEADMAWAISRRKPFFFGRRAIEVQMKRGLTRKLVGFTLAEPGGPLPEESHLVIRNGEITGRVTSIVHSPTLNKPIGLAFVAPDQAEPDQTFSIKGHDGRMIEARVAATPFYDPENKRQKL